MPDIKEKLVELLCHKLSLRPKCEFPTGNCGCCSKIADHLIANGVTIKTEPQTNADCIRAMSDEELAEFLTHINPTNCQDCGFSVGWRCQPDRDDYSDFDKCKEGRKRWLKQPEEEVP